MKVAIQAHAFLLLLRSHNRSITPGLGLALTCFLVIADAQITIADHPAHPLTVQLGPNGEDFAAEVEQLKNDRFVQLSKLRGFSLAGRDLRLSTLHTREDSLLGVSFDGANLSGSDLNETQFDGCSFRGAILRDVNFSRAGQIRPNCDLSDADISGATIVLYRHQLESTRNFQRKDLSRCYLGGEDLGGVDLSGFNLRGTRLPSGMDNSLFVGASIVDATLTLTKEQLITTKEFKEGDLSGVTLEGSDYTGLNLSGMTLGRFKFCDLTGAYLTDAIFHFPMPAGHSASNVRHLRDLRCGFYACQVSPEQFYSTFSYQRKILPPGFEFREMDLTGWDFRGMDLRGVRFIACKLDGALFDDARGGIYYPRTINAEQVRSMWSYKNNRMHDGMYLSRELASEFSIEYPE